MSVEWDESILGPRPESNTNINPVASRITPAGYAPPRRKAAILRAITPKKLILSSSILIVLSSAVFSYFNIIRPNSEVKTATAGIDLSQLKNAQISPSGTQYITLTVGDQVNFDLGFDQAGMIMYTCKSSNENVVKIEGQTTISAINGGISRVVCSTDVTSTESSTINVEVVNQ